MKRKAKIFYVAMDDFWRKEEKLTWLRENPISKIAFESIVPDEKHNWINQTDNDFETFIPLRIKGEHSRDGQIFQRSSLGISTNRDEWTYDANRGHLVEKIEYFINKLNEFVQRRDTVAVEDRTIKWSRDLRSKIDSSSKLLEVNPFCIAETAYRPFITYYGYLDKILIDRLTDQHFKFKGPFPNSENKFINYTDISSGKPFMALASKIVADLHFVGAGAGTMILPFHVFEGKIRHDNITDWAVEEFARRGASWLTKDDIFHYVYAVLHYPPYREKYEQNLKREFPRIPVYENALEWARLGKELMELHLNYETADPYPLKSIGLLSPKNPVTREGNPVATAPGSDKNDASRADKDAAGDSEPFVSKAVPKLRADKEAGVIVIDSHTSLEGVPAIAWEYRLGNRSALEWVLDQYKERKPKDPTIAEKFNTYKFEDYKDHVIDLLKRVCTVSVKTMEIIKSMPEA